VTDAKEVGVENAAEETCCHRTIPNFPLFAAPRYPFLVIRYPFVAYKPRYVACTRHLAVINY
jgi:hypothetical protein